MAYARMVFWSRTPGTAVRSETCKALSAQSVRRTLAVALRIAGLPVEWTPRELRHSFVSLMSANGASMELMEGFMAVSAAGMRAGTSAPK